MATVLITSNNGTFHVFLLCVCSHVNNYITLAGLSVFLAFSLRFGSCNKFVIYIEDKLVGQYLWTLKDIRSHILSHETVLGPNSMQ